MKKEFIVKSAFGIALFNAMLPLAFSFGQNQIHFLSSSQYSWIIWVGLGISATILLTAGKMLSKAGLAALCVLYALAPLAFYFTNGEAQFLILGTNTWIAVGCWAVSLLSFVQYKSVRVLQH